VFKHRRVPLCYCLKLTPLICRAQVESGRNSIMNTPKKMRRTAQVNVKMSEDDFALLRKAAEKRWPDAIMTNSAILLALARISARQILGKRKK
jgi:hypothetical protein